MWCAFILGKLNLSPVSKVNTTRIMPEAIDIFFSSFSPFFFFFFLIIVSVGAADFLFQSQLLVSDCCSDSQLNPVKIRQNYGGSASQKGSRVWLLGLRDEKSSMKLEHCFSVSYTEDLLQAIDYISVFLNHYFRCLNYS